MSSNVHLLSEEVVNPESSAELWTKDAVDPLIDQLVAIREEMLRVEQSIEAQLEDLPAARRVSARNLIHYVVLRGHDIRALQELLVARGLSSLGRCESYVMANVEAVLGILRQMTGREIQPLPAPRLPVGYVSGRQRIEENTEALLGEKPGHPGPAIMVTMPSEAGDDGNLVRELMEAGMDVVRINCAHDDPAVWSRMIGHLRRAEEALGRKCRVAMDLAGPKIRTGAIQPGPRVLSWRPHRDSCGRVVASARIWLAPGIENPMPTLPVDAVLPIVGHAWRSISAGDELRFSDAAGRARMLKIVQVSDRGLWAESDQTTHVTPETSLRHVPRGGDGVSGEPIVAVGEIPPLESFLVLRKGDRLLVTDDQTLGQPASYGESGRLIHTANIGCTLPEIFRDVHRGERILFDDGKIAGVVEEASPTHLLLEITRARLQGDRLRADKGINLPDSDLRLPALTEKDIEDLEFAVQHADMVNYSFVRRAEDIRHLQGVLNRLGSPDLGIILKIENRQAFENLPLLLGEVMRNAVAGVMIARGDLAVECGWERLAEIQEEILWMCEAAHMPVVWATQVLEGLAKKGLPTRAEVTDAAMGARAECVMLNKGPNITETVRMLQDILRRMQEHQVKKRPTFRRLKMAAKILAARETP